MNTEKSTNTCNGDCGMNYCEDNGCLERKKILTEPTHPLMDYTEQPFNLETALKHPEWVRTKDGREIDFIKDYPETRGFFSIVSITKCGSFYLVNKNGKVGQLESDFDLILRVPYREVWVNIYPNGNCVWYDTKEEANEYNSNSTTIVACVPVKIPAI